MHSPFVGELMGTLVLILLGDGVVANVLLKRSKAEGAGWMVITSGWCFAVLAGILTAGGGGGNDAHIKSPVTIGVSLLTEKYSQVNSFITPPKLGAFLGAGLFLLAFFPPLE